MHRKNYELCIMHYELCINLGGARNPTLLIARGFL